MRKASRRRNWEYLHPRRLSGETEESFQKRVEEAGPKVEAYWAAAMRKLPDNVHRKGHHDVLLKDLYKDGHDKDDGGSGQSSSLRRGWFDG